LAKKVQRSLDDIAAIATPPGQGGIGVVRVSGSDLSRLTTVLIGKVPIARHATYSTFLDSDGQVIDRGIAIFFPGPNSYTGEDVLELQAHGGSAVLQLLLKRCLSVGARTAQPGEFTLRAFLNNKLDLVQAESVADLISATSEQAVRSANRSLQGGFSKSINSLVDELIALRILIEATIDFPEEELDLSDFKRIEDTHKVILHRLEQTFKLAKQGSLLREGAHIVLVGQPNVGKSSLLNCLAGEDIALVSEIAGTTRDIVRQSISINGVPLHLIDTAGLRESGDIVEKMGMERTKLAMQKADLVVVIMETSNENPQEHSAIINLIPKHIPKLYVINKIDLYEQKPRIELHKEQLYIYLSAKRETGIDLLRGKILEMIEWREESGVFMARERHLLALEQALQYIKGAASLLNSLELLAEELRLAQEALSKITGEFSSDDLLGEIFSHFCIGK
jgi:tRNA modification GTPase